MYSGSLFVLALAVFGASAQSFVSSGCGLNGLSGVSGVSGVSGFNGLNGFGGLNGVNGFNGLVSGVNTGIVGSGLNTVGAFGNGFGASTSAVVENAPIRLPSLVTPTSVQESCNTVKTIVRPSVRKEVFTIPSVQRFVQTSSTPLVETVPYVTGSSVEIPSVGVSGGFGSGLVSGANTGFGSGLVSGVESGLVSGVNTGFGSGLVSGVNNGFGSGLVSGVNNGFVGTGLVSGVNTGIVGSGLVSGVNNGFVGTGLVSSGINSGCGCGSF